LENVTTNEHNNLTTDMQMSTTRSDSQFENVTTNERNNLTTDMQIMSTTRGDTPFENATTNERNSLLHDEEHHNEHLIEAYLVNEDDEPFMMQPLSCLGGGKGVPKYLYLLYAFCSH
jgi:hypothetical protein